MRLLRRLAAGSLLAMLPLAAQAPAAPAPTPAPTTPIPTKVRWTDTQAGEGYPPFLVGTEALFTQRDGTLSCRSLADGAALWSLAIAARPLREVGPHLFVLTDNYELSCVEAATGKLLWTTRVEKEGAGAFGKGGVVVVQDGFKGPVVAGDKVVMGTFGGSLFRGRTGRLYALNLEDGKLLWSFEAEDGVEQLPIIHKDKVLIGGVSACYGVELATGKQVWKASTRSDNQWTFRLEQDTLLMASGHYGAQKSMFGGTLYAFQADTGAQLWKFDIGGPSVLRVDQGKVLGIEWGSFGGSRLSCLDLATGNKVWEFKEKSSSWPIVKQGKAVYLNKDNQIFIVDLATGKADATLQAAGDFQMGFFKGPWGRFLDPLFLGELPVVGSWDKAKQETVLQPLDLAAGKALPETRFPGEVYGLWQRKEALVVFTKGADKAFTLKIVGP